MGEVESPNLIDLSVDDTVEVLKERNDRSFVPLIPSPQDQLSTENNPFDAMQKLAISRLDDPFDIVEKEASFQSRQICRTPATEVRIGNLLELNDNDNSPSLDKITPPSTVNLTPDSSSAESFDRKLKGTQKYRNRLLKLSICNSTFNTPPSIRKTVGNEIGCSPMSGGALSEHMIDSESPLKLVDDDIMSEEPPETIYTEKDYDADLELLKIPMLKSDSPSLKNIESEKQIIEQQCKLPSTNGTVDETKFPDINAIRSKLNARQKEATNNKDISEMINNLKNLIGESKMVDERKKGEINVMLETLTSTLSSNTSTVSPQPIKRQGTFDLELQDSSDKVDPMAPLHIETDIGNLVKPLPHLDDVPDIMVKSSATYDGESEEDKGHLNLPQIDPISPSHDESTNPNINEIMDQLQRFLEQHQLGSQANGDSTNVHSNPIASSNPTFIVVMPTLPQNSFNEESTDSSHNSSFMRRRSQSLSIHDKLRIVQLPIKTSTGNDSIENQSPPLSTNLYNCDASDTSDFKTPARFLPRRNSFSSATPCSPRRFSRLNGSGFGKMLSSGSKVGGPFDLSSNRSNSSENSKQPPISQSHIGLTKPNLKKNVRATSSIFKSNVPLKATIPVKKVMPSKTQSSLSNTSMHLVAKSGHMSNTSTPCPKTLNKGPLPNIFTTPTGSKNGRYLNAPNPAIGKTLNVTETQTNNFRRRTISELKNKSPFKARLSATESLTNGKTIKSNSKAINSRVSYNGPGNQFISKNKENKQP